MAGLNSTPDIFRTGDLGLDRPGHPFYVLGALQRIFLRRKLLYDLTLRSLRLQYTQTILGYFWVVLSPLAQLLVLNFVFAGILGRGGDSDQYVLVLALGFFPWHLYAGAISGGSESLVRARGLIGSMSLPRDFLVIASVSARILDFVVIVALMIGLLVWTNHAPPASVVWVPLIFFFQLVFTVGLALPLAALNVFYHDVRFLIALFLRVWFWMTPVFYTVDEVPEQYRFVYELNPLAKFIDAYRLTMLSGRTPAAADMAYIVFVPVLVLILGYVVYSKLERTLVDRA